MDYGKLRLLVCIAQAKFHVWQKAKGRRQKAEGFYVYYWYVVVWVVKSVLTFMATAIAPGFSV